MAVKQPALGSATFKGTRILSRPRRLAEVVGASAFASATLSRFLAVGGVSYLVNQAALVLLYDFVLTGLPRATATPLGHVDFGLLVASVLAVEIAILVRFGLNDGWTFRSRRQNPFWQRLYQSNLSSLASPVISIAAVNVLTPLLGISYLVSNSIGILVGLAWNWVWSTKVVWRREPAGA
jgi:putative flippase GtrA